tara:strand:+ start:205 stop:1029 length:825 start_codon:yes stop_codon:yes gene_type:complete
LRAYSSHKDIIKLVDKVGSVGIVPTMGSLHEGHLSLIRKALTKNKKVIVSIYVNPMQFDNSSDLKKYPRNIKYDLQKLESFNDILVYTPDDNDIYEEDEKKKKYNFGQFTKIMEGKIRPGHFDGVATIVEKLLRMFNPSDAYFGEKDFQQLILIKTLVKKLKLKVNIIGCETIREDDGLAMSSRNKLLDISERKSAVNIIRLLRKAKQLYKNSTLEETKSNILKDALLIENLKLEYFEILDLSMISDFLEEEKEIRAFIACKVGKIRLIDNIVI